MSTSRREFEEWYARGRGQTAEELGRRGWISALDGGEWQAICIPPDMTAEQKKRLLAGLISVTAFGETPPTDGAGGGT